MSVRPTPANLHDQLLSLARVELVIKPNDYGLLMMRGAPELWRASLWDGLSEVRLEALRITLLPTPSKVVGRLRTEKDEDLLTNQESRIFLWLKDYIRCLDRESLRQFLHFVTGSNTMPVLPIIISINSRMGLNRVPRAHTCGAVLELSTAYTSTQEFKRELNTIVSSPQAMVMNLL